jgi:hypothetical protein
MILVSVESETKIEEIIDDKKGKNVKPGTTRPAEKEKSHGLGNNNEINIISKKK